MKKILCCVIALVVALAMIEVGMRVVEPAAARELWFWQLGYLFWSFATLWK